MKLICELTESVDYELIEEGAGGKKQYFIEGIFMQSEQDESIQKKFFRKRLIVTSKST